MNTTDGLEQTSDLGTEQLQRTHYRVPRGNQQYLVRPAQAEALPAIDQNRERLNSAQFIIWGKPLQVWRAEARKQCLEKAVCFTARTDASGCQQIDSALPIVATGHQPELYHPGVWMKNVLADTLARKTGGIALNITIDSDTIKKRGITVPALIDNRLTQRRVVVDEWPLGMPWQEARIQNRELFDTFAHRVSQQLTGLQNHSVIQEYWSAVRQKMTEQSSLVAALIAGRRKIEQQLGLQTLEVPISSLCQTRVYCEFIASLILDAEQFRRTYNRALQQYRQTYQLKSASHPMPDLDEQEGWVELPLWMWTADNWHRRSVFVRRENQQLQLTDRDRQSWAIPIDSSHAREQLAEGLAKWMQQGLRLRTRALMTTLFLRLFVSDWFIHGIGGAKYDEITDAIIAEYWNFSPPDFQVATGTLWLPLNNTPVFPETSSQDLRQQLRVAEENPEILRTETSEYADEWEQLLRRKHELIQQQQQRPRTGLTRRERRNLHEQNVERHLAFKQMRNQMIVLVEPQLEQLRARLHETEQREQRLQIAIHREYPFCCYPLDRLREIVKHFRDSRPTQG